jgi:hypothetical protein
VIDSPTVLTDRKHRIGPPVKPFVPPAPLRSDREAIGYYRSPELDAIVSAID